MHCKQRVRKGGGDTAFETQARSSWRRLRATLVLVIAYLGISIPILADKFDWNGPNGGRWDVLANWQQNGRAAARLPGTVAGVDDDVDMKAEGANKVVLLENAKGVGTLSVKNITFRPSSAEFPYIIITTNGKMTLDGKSVATANPGTQARPAGGDILLTSRLGALAIDAKLTAGNGNGFGSGGKVELEARGAGGIRTGGIITAGGSELGRGGDVKIRATDSVVVGGTVEAGKGGTGTRPGDPVHGGEVVITSDTGNVEINSGLFAGDGGLRGGRGGSIRIATGITAAAGDIVLNAQAHVRGGDGGNPVNPNDPAGPGGSVTIDGKNKVEINSKVFAGKGGDGGRSQNRSGGSISITAGAGDVVLNAQAHVQGGNGGNPGGQNDSAGPGGPVTIRGKNKVEINSKVFAGKGGDRGGRGGSIDITTTGIRATAGNVVLSAQAHVQGGNGGIPVERNDPAGPGGPVTIKGTNYVGKPNSQVKGGNGGFKNDEFKVGRAGNVTLNFTGKVTHDGLLRGGDGLEGGIVEINGKEYIAGRGAKLGGGKKLGGSRPGVDTFGADTFGPVKIYAQESITIDPYASIRGGWIDIVTSPGTLIDLQELDSDAISADTSIRISAGDQSGQVKLLGAQRSPSYAITAGVGIPREGTICIFGRPILDDGVTLADVTDPEANNPSTPCPPPMGNPFQVTVSANPIWTNTGLDLTSNDWIQIRDAVGSWNWGTLVPDFGPDGYDISTSFPDLVDDEWITNGLHGQLIGVVLPVGMNPNMYSADEPLRIIPQDDPRLFEIGSDSVTLTGVSGRLWLGFNDDYEGDVTDDNSGSITVWIDLSQ